MIGRRRFRKFDDKKLEALRTGKFFAVLVLALALVFSFVIGISGVDGMSMYPTLRNGQPVVYDRLTREYAAGDIVSVRMPNGQYYVKRIVAMGGDTVNVSDGALYVNGIRETAAWVNGATEPQGTAVKYPLTLPEGSVFVLGDNRPVSVDSRTFGAAALSQIRGRILGK